MPSLKHNFSYQFLAALSSLLFPLITFPYITRTLGPAMLGKVNYVDFLAGLIISLTCLGIPLYGTREIAKARHDAALRQRLFGDLLRIHLAAALMGLIVFVLFLYAHPRFAGEHMLVVLGAVYILSNVLSAEWYLQGMEAFRFSSLRSIVLRSIGIGAIFLLLHQPGDYVYYYGIIAGTQLVTVLVNYAYIKPRLNPGMTSKAAVREHGPLLFYFFIASTFISIYDYTDTVMLGWLSNDENVGYYTTSMKLVKLSLVLILAVNTILFPRLAHVVAEKKEEEARQLMRQSIDLILTLAVPALGLYLLMAPELILLFAGPDFEPSVTVMRWLSPLPLVIAFSNLFLLYYLSRFTQNRRILWLVSAALIISLGLNYLLIPLWREQGAAAASLCTETFIMVCFGIWMRIRIPFRPLWQSVLATAVFVPLVLGTRALGLDTWQTVLAAIGLCGLAYYILQQWLLRNDSVRSGTAYALSLIKSGKKKT